MERECSIFYNSLATKIKKKRRINSINCHKLDTNKNIFCINEVEAAYVNQGVLVKMCVYG